MDKNKYDHVKKNLLRKSISTFGFISRKFNKNLRQAKSFTGVLHELKSNKLQQNLNYYIKRFYQHQIPKEDAEYITKEVSSDKIFVVRNAMLNYRGTQYSVHDIATRWKKDCRMWLWKGSWNKRYKSVSEIRERIEVLRLPASEKDIPNYYKQI